MICCLWRNENSKNIHAQTLPRPLNVKTPWLDFFFATAVTPGPFPLLPCRRQDPAVVRKGLLHCPHVSSGLSAFGRSVRLHLGHLASLLTWTRCPWCLFPNYLASSATRQRRILLHYPESTYWLAAYLIFSEGRLVGKPEVPSQRWVGNCSPFLVNNVCRLCYTPLIRRWHHHHYNNLSFTSFWVHCLPDMLL